MGIGKKGIGNGSGHWELEIGTWTFELVKDDENDDT